MAKLVIVLSFARSLSRQDASSRLKPDCGNFEIRPSKPHSPETRDRSCIESH